MVETRSRKSSGNIADIWACAQFSLKAIVPIGGLTPHMRSGIL